MNHLWVELKHGVGSACSSHPVQQVAAGDVAPVVSNASIAYGLSPISPPAATKGQESLGIRAIAGGLTVRHVLEGRVRRTGDALRITAQLIDAEPVLREQLQFWLGQNILADAVFPGMRARGEAAMAALSLRCKGAGRFSAPDLWGFESCLLREPLEELREVLGRV